MKKIFIANFIVLTISELILSCSNDKENIEQPGPDIMEKVTDLSADGLANCYIVQEPGIYIFKADNQFNLGEGLPVPPEISPESAGLIWQTVNSSIKSVELVPGEDGLYVKFEVSDAEGNALIGVYDSKGEIEWSWHIWMPKEEITSIQTSTGYEVMNMNLGALSNEAGNAESYGMLYQWGRKDPFPASETLTGDANTVSTPMYDIEGNRVMISNSSWSSDEVNTIAYSIANPTVCLSNYSHYSTSRDWLNESDDSLWGNPDGYLRDSESNTYINKGVKTCYDPSPLGWRVAPADAFKNFTSSGGYSWTYDEFNVADVNSDGNINIDDYNYGWNFYVNENTSLYFPAAARFDGSYAMLMGSVSGLWGNYWSNAPANNSSFAGGALSNLSFQIKDQMGNDMITVSIAGAGSRADAYSIRCIKDN